MTRINGHDLTWVVHESLRAGARFILFREKHLPFKERLALAQTIADKAHEFQAQLIVASDHTIAAKVGATGVHLSSTDAPERAGVSILGRSCHNATDVTNAHDRVDYVTYSPIFPTPSKPGYGPALGPDSITTVAITGPPLYALGGITPERVKSCLQAGAYGVAVMGGIMTAADPAETTARFLRLLT